MKIKVWVEFNNVRDEVTTSVPDYVLKDRSGKLKTGNELDMAIREYAITIRNNIMEFGYETE